MNQVWVFVPVMAMIGLTAIVWGYMFVLRWNYLVEHNIASDDIGTPEKLAAACSERVNNPANNFKNLFELPVIFYVVCGVSFVTASVDWLLMCAAWAFVILRACHSWVHCTTNHVDQRFYIYQASCMALWFMVIKVMISVVALI